MRSYSSAPLVVMCCALMLGGCASDPASRSAWSQRSASSATLGRITTMSESAGAPDLVFIRFVDVGQGLCVFVRTPSDKTMLYDAGDKGRGCAEAVAALKPQGTPIDLLVLSHGDSDHSGGIPQVLEENEVRTIIWTGTDRETQTAVDVEAAIESEHEAGAEIFNLASDELERGTVFDLDELKVTFVAGWSEDNPFSDLRGGEAFNVKSIVMRLDYGQNSVLLTGDTIGRRGGVSTPADECREAEAFMVEHASEVPIDVEVMSAPHHGGNNGSSLCFIEAASPRIVVFSAGHNGTYKHPRLLAAERYLRAGVQPELMFRTDRGDDEGEVEWDWLRVPEMEDKKGDDHVDIYLPGDAMAVACYSDGDDPAACN